MLHSLDGDLLYACSLIGISQALDEAAATIWRSLRESPQVRVTRLRPRPWSTVPFLLHPLTLMRGARA